MGPYERGRYEEAADRYTHQLGNRLDAPTLRNRALAYLMLDRFAAALEGYQMARELDGEQYENSSDCYSVGICHWWMGHADLAVAEWRRAVHAPYTDAAGGVETPALLLYAGSAGAMPTS